MATHEVRIDTAGPSELSEIRSNLERFWFGTPPVALHHPMFVREFGDTAYVARNDAGEIVGYLLGFVTHRGVGYIHLVAVRDDARGQGISRTLYETFTAEAQCRGAVRLKAIANPKNEATAAFHRSLGFSATPVDDYGGTGQSRLVFEKDLGIGSDGDGQPDGD